jgi:hypothetical protein
MSRLPQNKIQNLRALFQLLSSSSFIYHIRVVSILKAHWNIPQNNTLCGSHVMSNFPKNAMWTVNAAGSVPTSEDRKGARTYQTGKAYQVSRKLDSFTCNSLVHLVTGHTDQVSSGKMTLSTFFCILLHERLVALQAGTFRFNYSGIILKKLETFTYSH